MLHFSLCGFDFESQQHKKNESDFSQRIVYRTEYDFFVIFFSGRLFVEASIHDEFVQRVVSHPEAILLSKFTLSYDKKLAVKHEHVDSCIWFYNRWKK